MICSRDKKKTKKKQRVASMESKCMRDRLHVLDKSKFKDEFNNLCFYRRAKGNTSTKNFIIACNTYINIHVVTICSRSSLARGFRSTLLPINPIYRELSGPKSLGKRRCLFTCYLKDNTLHLIHIVRF